MVGTIVDFAATGYKPDIVVVGTGPRYLAASDNPHVYGEGLLGVTKAIQAWLNGFVRFGPVYLLPLLFWPHDSFPACVPQRDQLSSPALYAAPGVHSALCLACAFSLICSLCWHPVWQEPHS